MFYFSSTFSPIYLFSQALCFFFTALRIFHSSLPLCFSLFIHFDFFHIFLGLSSFFSPIHSFIHFCIFLVTYFSCFHLCSLFPFTYLSIFFHCIYYYILPSVTLLIQTIYFNSLFSSSILLFHPNVYHSFFSLHLSFWFTHLFIHSCFLFIHHFVHPFIYSFILCSLTHHLFIHFFFTHLSIYLVFVFVHPICSFIILGLLYT